jgi:hypothetical protein
MELLILGLVFLICYLFLRLGAKLSAWVSGTHYRAYRHLAALYGGRCESRGLGTPPTVSFAYHGSNIRVGLAPSIPGQATSPRTRVVARFARGLPFRLELAPVARPAPPQSPKGTRLVRLGEPAFDRGYVVQANDPEMAQGFLTPAVRWAIDHLQRMAPPSGMLVSVNPERLLVQVDRNLGLNPEALAGAVREALVILDGLVQGVAARVGQGVAIVQAGPADAEDAGPPICKVCGEPITAPGVVCASCRTPHHRDCWEFIGACSIFGCNGKQSLSA